MTDKVIDEIKDHWVVNVVSWVVLLGLVVALIKLASMNIVPYIWFVKNFGHETNQMWVEYLPVIGTLHKGFMGFVHGIAGILLWGLVQALQTLWVIVGLDRRAHGNALREARASRVDNKDATSYEKRMSKKAQAIPFFFLKWSALLALGAYAFDGVLGVSVFPPADSLQTFLFALGSGMTNQIDGKNVLQLLTMMFSFELLLIPTVVVAQWQYHRSQGV
ncbi:hypothetical protein QGP82_14580 [Leptothoe sp. LEGE 181152]|nr:hypothetical protein [Leptothoe sp. LEGE 181152]